MSHQLKNSTLRCKRNHSCTMLYLPLPHWRCPFTAIFNTKYYLHYATAEASRRPMRIREGFLLDGHFHMRIIYYYIAGISSVNVGAEIAWKKNSFFKELKFIICIHFLPWLKPFWMCKFTNRKTSQSVWVTLCHCGKVLMVPLDHSKLAVLCSHF